VIHGRISIDPEWVGIDGYNNGTVEQLGTATQCFEGVTYYYVWYEMFPAGTVEEGTVACINNNVDCPQPGDRISASVTVTPGGNYTLSLSGGRTTDIGGFQDGPVYDVAMTDDTDSYFLDCVGQRGFGPQLLQTTDPNACPTVPSYKGGFPSPGTPASEPWTATDTHQNKTGAG